jgi:hypothetical protein
MVAESEPRIRFPAEAVPGITAAGSRFFIGVSMTGLVELRIANIQDCTVEELFGFLVVLMVQGDCTVNPTRQNLDGIEKAIKAHGGGIEHTGMKIVNELKSRVWKKKDISHDRIIDHAVGVQCTDVCNMMSSGEEIEGHSTIVKDILHGSPRSN